MKSVLIKGGKYALIDDEDFLEVIKHRWYLHSLGYAMTTNSGKTTLMHRLILNTPRDKYTDHINRDKLDNRRSNLRVCTPFESTLNRKTKRGRSGVKGVLMIGPSINERFRACIGYKGRTIFSKSVHGIENAKVEYQKLVRLYRVGTEEFEVG